MLVVLGGLALMGSAVFAPAQAERSASVRPVCPVVLGDPPDQGHASRTGDHYLTGVSITSANDVWAVGIGRSRLRGATLHWDGLRWATARTGLPDRSGVWAVASVSQNDVWTVGVCNDRPIASHWDGSTWTTMALPLRDYGRLVAVDARSADDVWAAGAGTDGTFANGPLAAHWDGSTWTTTKFPDGYDAEFSLQAITARSTDDVWAVGNGYRSKAYHWDGRAWSDRTDGVHDRWYLEDVAILDSGEVWAVGRAYPKSGYGASTLVLRWDGSRWQRVASPSPDLDDQLYAIDVVGPDDVWAVGSSSEEPGAVLEHNLIEHWDGTRWTVVPAPSPGREHNVLLDVAAADRTDAWAVGGRSSDEDWWYTGAQVLLHWDGSEWAQVHKG